MGRALDTRDVIGRATGILMERYTITGQQAFAVLTRHSQAHNRRLKNLAEEPVEAGELVAVEQRGRR